MAYNNSDIDAFGKPKYSAWKWLFSNYGTPVFFWALVCPYGIVALWGDIWVLAPIIITLGILGSIGIYAPKWYKQLVENNYIQTFSRSKFSDLWKK